MWLSLLITDHRLVVWTEMPPPMHSIRLVSYGCLMYMYIYEVISLSHVRTRGPVPIGDAPGAWKCPDERQWPLLERLLELRGWLSYESVG